MARKGKIGPVIAIDGETEFKRSIKSINDNLGVLTSELKKVDAEFGKNETSIEGARSKIEIYRKQLEQLSQKEKLQSQALQDAQKRYSEAGDKVGELKNKLAAAEKEMDELKNSSDATTAEIKEQRTVIKDLETDLKKAEKQYSAAEKSTKDWQKALNNTQADIATSRRDMEQLATSTIKTKEAFEAAEKRLETWQSRLGKMGNALTIGVTAPLVTAGAGMFKAAEDFESAFAGVTKTVDGTAGEISGLRQGIIDMAKEIPSSTTEISAVAEAAGQLGIQVPNILGFTRTMIDLGNSTNISAEEAASSLAKFANVTNMSQEDFDRLGSAIVDLGNNFATTEADIVAMATRLSGAGAQIGLSEGEILGFATALSSVGIEAEMGGSAFSKAMVAMQVACETGLGPVKQLTEKTGMSLRDLQLMSENSSKDFTALADSLGMTKSELQNMVDAGSDLEGFAEIAGMTADQFQKAFREDAAGAIEAFIKGLGDTENKSESTIVMLENLGFTEVRLRDTMTRLANSGDLVTKAVDMGNAAWDENVALTEEAGKRYETTESKLKIAKNQITDAARIMGENMLPVVGNLAEDLSKLTDKFSALSPETQKTIIKLAAAAAAIGPVTKGLSGMTGAAKAAVGGVKNLVTALSKQTAVKKAADGLTGVASAATSVAGATAGAGSGVTGFAGILSKLASPTGAAVAAAGAVLAIGAAAWKAHEDMVKADIAAHFGDIELAAEEVEDVATRLTTTDWTMRINTYMDAEEKLGTYEENIQSAISEINKTEWKISVGLELTDEEKKAYQESITNYVQSCQQYIEEKGYVVNLAIAAGFESGSPTGESLSAWANEYYASASTELAELGQELSDVLEESLVNGTFDENQGRIDELKQKMISVINQTVADATNAEYEGTISDFEITIGEIDMGDLTKESFDQVNEKIGEYTDQIQEIADNANAEVKKTISLQYAYNIQNGMPQATAKQIMNDSLTQLQLDLNKQKGEVIVQGIDFSFDTINENFGYRVDDALEKIDQDFSKAKDKFMVSFSEISPDDYSIAQAITDSIFGSDKALKRSVSDAMESLEPQKDQLEKIAKSYLDAGKAVPQNIVKGLTDVYQMSAISGSVEDMYKLWAKDIANSPEKMEALAEAKKSGQQIPEGVIEAVEMYSGKIYNAVTGMWEEPVKATQENIQPILDYLNKSGLDCGDEAAKGLAASYGLIYDAASKTWIAVSDATLDSEPNIKSVVEQCGLTVTDALITSIQGQNEPTKQQMLILLQQLVAATDEQREPILLKLAELGVDVSASLSQGMMSNYSFVESSTEGMVDVIDKTSGEKIATLKQPMAERLADAVGGAIDYVNNQTTQKGPQLDPPTIKEFDPTKLDTWADKTMWALQRSLEGHGTLTVPVKTVASPGDRPIDREAFPEYANGGKITEEGLYWGAEGDKAEYVIPTDPAKRQRAISLYSQAGKELGIIPESAYTPPTLPVQPSGVQLDYTKLAKAIAAELRSAPVETSVSINVQEGGVYLDNELVGRQQAPVISRIQAKHI
ncbi:MAG TPA: phage tail tape measure protein [Candidatus Onthovicinus excrementipullorum]|nr:phage tail tape measure protein [Candidatus Onthovicinus excrementipullorum]